MSRAGQFLAFLAVVAVVAVTLRLLRDVPTGAEGDDVRHYRTLEEVQRRYRDEHILLPAYFPSSLQWPPSEIYAGRRPAFASVMHFFDSQSAEIVLAVGQAASREVAVPSRIDPARVLSTSPVALSRSEGELTLALCADERPCNQVHLERGGHLVAVTGRFPAEELIKIADSLR